MTGREIIERLKSDPDIEKVPQRAIRNIEWYNWQDNTFTLMEICDALDIEFKLSGGVLEHYGLVKPVNSGTNRLFTVGDIYPETGDNSLKDQAFWLSTEEAESFKIRHSLTEYVCREEDPRYEKFLIKYKDLWLCVY